MQRYSKFKEITISLIQYPHESFKRLYRLQSFCGFVIAKEHIYYSIVIHLLKREV